MRRPRPSSRSALLPCVLAVTLVAGTSCRSTSSPEAQPPVVDAAGGTVTEPGGASVVVPPGALATPVTVRIAKDSTGAPAAPVELPSAGDTYAITPHGLEFTAPVEVRIPVPPVTLQPNEELRVAQAELGGEWVILNGAELVDGTLRVRVTGFSFFRAVVITYPLPIAQFEPFRVQSERFECDGRPCPLIDGFTRSPVDASVPELAGPVTVVHGVTTNNGQLPAGCTTATQLFWRDGDSMFNSNDDSRVYTPSLSGSVTRTIFPPRSGGVRWFDVMVACPTGPWFPLSTWGLKWRGLPVYPALTIVRAPARLEVVEGTVASVEVVLLGGPQDRPQTHPRPTVNDRAVVAWERSDDGGASWHEVARSYQDEGDPDPYRTGGGDYASGYWSVHHAFVATAADQGALIRARGCYQPPDVAAAPCVTGAPARLVVLPQGALPAIVDAPRSVLVTVGQTASFSATASGVPAPTLRWQTRPANSVGAWTDVASGTGATTGSYTTPVLALAENGTQYRVVATNAVGSAVSPPVTVSVSALGVAPTITTQPASLAVVFGSDAAFAIAARGTEALGYQWRLGGTPIPGANGPVLRLLEVTAENAGDYDVVVTNEAGTAKSAVATLTVGPGAPPPVAPTIVTQPAAVTVAAGNTATFAVGVSGTGPISFQWRKDGVAVPGATAAALTLPAAAAGDVGAYSVVVSNPVGAVTSADAALQLAAGPPPVVTAPSITTQPSTLVVIPGGAATLAVAASGTGPLTYAWTHDGVAVPGATGPVLFLASVTALDAGSYQVTVANTAGSAPSSTAQLVVVATPTITAQPLDTSAFVGATATFTVGTSGEALRFQWLRDGVELPGATSASYTTPALALADGGAVFRVIVYSGAGLALSQGAVLTVTTPPAITRTTLASVSTEGVAANNVSTLPELSADGRLVAFVSTGTNLVAGMTTSDVDLGSGFVRDLGAGVTTLVNQTPDGKPSSRGVIGHMALAAGGRFVAFSSLAGDLVDGDTNGSEDVFLRDLQTGTTKRLSVIASGAQTPGAGGQFDARLSISADGRWVTFISGKDLLGDGSDLPSYALFLRDTLNDVTRLVTADPNGGAYPTVTGDGSQVIFLASSFGSSNQDHLLSYDIATGATATVFTLDRLTFADGIGPGVSVSSNGRYVAFPLRSATELGGAAALVRQVAVLDRQAPGQPSLTLGSTGPGGTGNRDSDYPSLSGDGRYVVFTTTSSNLTGDVPNSLRSYLVVRDLVAGTTAVTSRRVAGSTAQTGADAVARAISADGALVGFVAGQFDVLGAGPFEAQVFVAPRFSPVAASVVLTPSQAAPGADLVLSVVVTGGAGTPAGLVTFREGTTVLTGKSPAASNPAALSGGTGQLNVCVGGGAGCLSTGAHTITAEYAGDATYAGATLSIVAAVN